MLRPVSALPILVAAAGLFAGGVALGAVGFGAVLVASPLVATVFPAVLPFVFVVPAVSTNGYVAWRERAALDRGFVARAVVMQVPGALLGAWLLAQVDDAALLGVLIGVLVLVLVGIQVLPWRPPRTPPWEMVAASLAGVSGAVSGMNGPPVAAIMAYDPPATIRGTLPAFFVAAQCVLVVTWWLTGVISWDAVGLGFAAAPVMLLGAVVGQRLAGRLTARQVRNAVILLAVVAVGRNLLVLA